MKAIHMQPGIQVTMHRFALFGYIAEPRKEGLPVVQKVSFLQLVIAVGDSNIRANH